MAPGAARAQRGSGWVGTPRYKEQNTVAIGKELIKRFFVKYLLDDVGQKSLCTPGGFLSRIILAVETQTAVMVIGSNASLSISPF